MDAKVTYGIVEDDVKALLVDAIAEALLKVLVLRITIEHTIDVNKDNDKK